MSDEQIIEAVAERARAREKLYAFTQDQIDALVELGVPMVPVNEKHIVAGVLEDLREAGWEPYRLEEWPEVVCFPGSNEGRIVNFDGQNLQVVGQGTTFAQMPRRGRYRLVPISGERPKEET